MNPLALEIPDDTAALAGWLEERIVGLELGDLIAQLRVGRPAHESPDLGDLLGESLDNVLSVGLRDCSAEQLLSLLNHPHVLFELQERIFIEGSDYWNSVSRSAAHELATQKVIDSFNASADVSPVVGASPVAKRDHRWARRLTLAALAASLLLAIGFFATRTPPPAGWGFNSPGLLTKAMPAPDYLNMLADAAGAWFKKPPENAQQLEKRLREFRAGCDTLLAADHPQLAVEDKTWLLDRCRAWRDRIDAQLASLASEPSKFAGVREEADEMVKGMVEKLRERAGQV